MAFSEVRPSSCARHLASGIGWSRAERCSITQQWFNACGRSNSERRRTIGPAAVLVQAFETYLHAASIARARRSSLDAGQAVSRPNRCRLAHDAAAAPSSPHANAAFHHASRALVAHPSTFMTGLRSDLMSLI
jgi:hypothetical protein